MRVLTPEQFAVGLASASWQPIATVPCDAQTVVLYDAETPRSAVSFLRGNATPDSLRLNGWTHWCWPPRSEDKPPHD